MTEQAAVIHPRVAAYLDQLSRLLVDLDPAERAEVIEGVREHIDARLADGARTEDNVNAALAAVGSAQDVADEAYAGRPASSRPQPRVPLTSRVWMPAVVAVLETLAVLVVLATAGSVGGVTTSSVTSGSAAGGVSTAVGETHFDGSISSGTLAFFAALPLWLVVVFLVAMSALWLGREKILLIAVVPVSAVAFAALPEIGYQVLGVDGVYAGGWLSIALAVLGGGAVVWVLTRRAHRRATHRSSS